MILEFDKNLEQLVESFTPSWTELQVLTRDFSKIGDASFATGAVLLAGERSLLCSMTAKDLSAPRIEYYPVYLKEVSQGAHGSDGWITLARSGGTSELERKVQWLFEKPSMRLLVSEEECADGMGPDAQQYLLKFYGGLEISDPQGRGSLRITACDMPDYIVTLSFSF
jgi:hypothetical protein